MKAVFHVAEKDAAQEREDVAIALTEQQVSSTTPQTGCRNTGSTSTGSVPKKGCAGRNTGRRGKNLNIPVVYFQSLGQGIVASH